MKLLSLKICIKLDNTDKVIKLLKNEDADICTLQEVMNGVDEPCFEI